MLRRLLPAALLPAAVAFALDDPRPTDRPAPLAPADAARSFTVPDDLRFDPVLAEPDITQPLSLWFDERGRLWVVEYRQYPAPAGLKLVSKDVYWRAVYDKVPEPPPHGVKGADRISIHEDTDGDGRFDKHSVFLDGLNIATAAVRGRGGVWVLNPPYLLFYPTRDNADRPTGDPEVRLSGFGLEDTHSVVNSLRWGPDGWLYAAQGSTVTAAVKLPHDDKVTRTLGQQVWRYHPERRIFEVFAEGGGNAFGLEIDSAGRIFSGHNGGNTRGFYYPQGAYERKGFEKHGQLSNPHAFGFFEAMRHTPPTPRFTHALAIDEGTALPEKYHGKLFGVNPLQFQVTLSDLKADGSTFQSADLPPAVTSTDKWFRPVAIQQGPDGGLYVADWYDPQLAHTANYGVEGGMDRERGRVYRLTGKDAKPLAPFDLGKKTTAELVEVLRHPNKWHRQTALRLLGDRRDPDAVPLLTRMLVRERGQSALEALWGLNLSGGFSEEVVAAALEHNTPAVREWAVRLVGDRNRVSDVVGSRLESLAADEPEVHVRSQLAATARRLPAGAGLAIVRRLLLRDADAADPHVPLLVWWAIEAKCEHDREDVLALFEDRGLWAGRMAREVVLPRLMRRLAAGGTRRDLADCVRLFRLAPSKELAALLQKGLEEAFAGRAVGGLPADLLAEVAKAGGGSTAFGVRLGRADAVTEALAVVADPKADAARRREYIELLGEAERPGALRALLAIARGKESDDLRKAALVALSAYPAPEVGTEVVALYPSLAGDVRDAAASLLAGRKDWSLAWLAAVDAGKVQPASVPVAAVRQMFRHRSADVDRLAKKHWGELKGATTEEMRREIDRLAGVVRSGTGDPYAGRRLYEASCQNCHTLHGKGGGVGPDLTPYKRDDVPSLLLNVVNPSAEVREGYENVLVTTTTGRVLSGVVAEKDDRVVVLRTAEGQRVTVPRDEVDEMTAAGASLMPEGLLKGLSDQQVRDLFAYLRSGQPLVGKP